nr:unnamed protein product [Spirometra erinaceieuropaei]
MSTDVPGTSRTYWTPSYQLHHPTDTTGCPPPSTSTSPLTPTVNTDRIPELPLPSSVASTSAVTPPVPIATALHPNTPTNINLTTTDTSDV